MEIILIFVLPLISFIFSKLAKTKKSELAHKLNIFPAISFFFLGAIITSHVTKGQVVIVAIINIACFYILIKSIKAEKTYMAFLLILLQALVAIYWLNYSIMGYSQLYAKFSNTYLH